MVDKNINIIYRAFGGEQVEATNRKIAESMVPLAKQSRTVIEQIGKATKSISYDIQTIAVQNRNSLGQFASGFQIVNKEIEKNIRTVEDHRQRFKMYLLSVMFFGMIIQRTFQKMAETTLGTFMKITEAQTSAGQAVSNLSAHWEYLKFSVGEAIGAFIEAHPEIINMIDAIADFVQQNGELISQVIIAGIVIGATFGTIGQLGLGISGLSMFGGAIKTAMGLGGTGGISGLVAALGGAGTAFLTLGVVALIGAGLIAFAMKHPEIQKSAIYAGEGLMKIFSSAFSFIQHFAAAEFDLIEKHDIPSFGDAVSQIFAGMFANWVNQWSGWWEWMLNAYNFVMKKLGQPGIVGEIKLPTLDAAKLKDLLNPQEVSYLRPEEIARLQVQSEQSDYTMGLNNLVSQGININIPNVTITNGEITIPGGGNQIDMNGGVAQFQENLNTTATNYAAALGVNQQDFISRPGTQPIPFSSEDTIIGVKKIETLMGGIRPITPSIETPELQPIEQPIYLKILNEASLNQIFTNANMKLPEISIPTPITNTTNTFSNPTTTNTISITNDINVDKMSSDVDIDKLTKDISSRIVDSLKSYGIGG